MTREYNLSVITMNISGAIGSGSWFKESVHGMMKKGMFRVFEDGQNWMSMIHVEDIERPTDWQ